MCVYIYIYIHTDTKRMLTNAITQSLSDVIIKLII